MQIKIRIANNYGIETAYPACNTSELFARIAGTKTLTRDTLKHVEALGYQITIAEQTFKTFKHLQTA